MLPSGAGVTVEKLDKIFLCAECKTVFLFRSDADDHEKMMGHSELRELPFDG